MIQRWKTASSASWLSSRIWLKCRIPFCRQGDYSENDEEDDWWWSCWKIGIEEDRRMKKPETGSNYDWEFHLHRILDSPQSRIAYGYRAEDYFFSLIQFISIPYVSQSSIPHKNVKNQRISGLQLSFLLLLWYHLWTKLLTLCMFSGRLNTYLRVSVSAHHKPLLLLDLNKDNPWSLCNSAMLLQPRGRSGCDAFWYRHLQWQKEAVRGCLLHGRWSYEVPAHLCISWHHQASVLPRRYR